MTEETNDGAPIKPKAVPYNGNVPLDVPIETFFHAMKAIVIREAEGAFLEKCQTLTQEQQNLLTSPQLANLIKSFFEEKELYTFSTEALEIMTSPPHKRCWPRTTQGGDGPVVTNTDPKLD
jgi:hypothetical protein